MSSKENPQHPTSRESQTVSSARQDFQRLLRANAWPGIIESSQRLRPGRRKETKTIIDFLDPQKDDQVLEIGYNLGYLLRQTGMKNSECQYTAIDINKPPKIAKERAGEMGATIMQADGTNTPFADNTFNKIVISHLLEHFDDPSVILNEISRLLSKNGSVIIAVPKERFKTPLSNLKGHKQFFGNIEKLKILLKENGFEVTEDKKAGGNFVIKAKMKSLT